MIKRRSASATKTGKKRSVTREADIEAAPQNLANKLSAGMSALLSQMADAGPRPVALTRSLAPRGAGPEQSERCVHVFVRSKDDSIAKAFPGLGLAEGDRLGTALVPLSRLRPLAEHPAVTRLSAPRELRPLMDVARPLVRLPQFVQETQSSGSGVIFGLVDSGLDVNHPAFAGRVLSLWDQTMQGPGPGDDFVPMGALLTGPAMSASLDTNGHGTHVTGIAAGAVPPYEGVAPQAEIIAVKTNFQNTAIAEAVRWIFSEATRLNRPAVVNLSLGGHGDAHDGSDDLSTLIGQEVGPGRIVVAAAGNEGTDAIHVSGVVTATKAATYSIRVAPNSSGLTPEFFILNGWYSGSGECEVRLTSSTGLATPFQAVLKTEPTSRTHALQNDRADIATPPATVNPNGDHQFFVVVESRFQGMPVQGGVWTLEVRRQNGQPGMLHVWLVLPSNADPRAAEFLGPDVSLSHLIGSPGVATEAVTVASFTSRNRWVDSAGLQRAVGLPVNTISDFSSPGPRRDGVLKPDVTAPGAMIVSCLSRASISPALAPSIVAPGFFVDAGTSMATPFIAGIAALLLEKQPASTPADVKKFLKARSRVPGQAAGTHDPKWGFGLLSF